VQTPGIYCQDIEKIVINEASKLIKLEEHFHKLTDKDLNGII